MIIIKIGADKVREVNIKNCATFDLDDLIDLSDLDF